MRDSSFSCTNRTATPLPRLPFRAMKEAVLGSRYELSTAFVSSAQARRITRATKKKDTASNVLAFPLSERSGEIILCPSSARAQASAYGKTPRQFLAYLFIHGLLHLKGYDHGATMERAERRFVKRFGF